MTLMHFKRQRRLQRNWPTRSRLDGRNTVARKVAFNFGPASVEWEPSTEEAMAAWEAYVEVTTRVSGTLEERSGLPREALRSLYDLFRELRAILRKHGPEVASKRASAGAIIIGLMNGYLRPFLSEWHPLLSEWEELRRAEVGHIAHARSWDRLEAFGSALAELYSNVDAYRLGLGNVAGVEVD